MGIAENKKSEKVKVTATLLPSGKSYQLGIPVDWTIEKFIDEFKRKTEKSDATPMLATLKRTNKELDPSSTIAREDIVDGDVIILREHVVGG